MPQSVPPASKGNATHEPLPPSVETAYWRKCIQLKRRINEIEENNDIMRLRKIRINRAILKMRLERAFLLEQLEKRMEYNADGSDRSTSPPPTVQPPFHSQPPPASTVQESPSLLSHLTQEGYWKVEDSFSPSMPAPSIPARPISTPSISAPYISASAIPVQSHVSLPSHVAGRVPIHPNYVGSGSNNLGALYTSAQFRLLSADPALFSAWLRHESGGRPSCHVFQGMREVTDSNHVGDKSYTEPSPFLCLFFLSYLSIILSSHLYLRFTIPQDKPLRSKRSHRKNTPPPVAGTSMGSQASPPQSTSMPQHQQLPPLQQIPLVSPTRSTPDPSRSGLFFGNHAISTPQQPAPGMNGTPVALQPYPQRPRPGTADPMPPLQPQHYDGYEDRRPAHALPENGTPAEYGRSYAPGIAGSEAIGASLGGADGANGERRPDAEMAEASPSGQQRPGSAGGFGGFTAVNRNV